MASLLKVDLTSQRIIIEDLTEMQNEYLGGVGVNTKLALELIPPSCSPVGGENVLLIGTGSLVGTNLPTACRTDITSKSPLSDRFGSSNSGDKWGVQLRKAGFDYIAITGMATRPLLLIIDNGRVSIEEATHLWGQDTWTTHNWIKVNKGNDFEVASIGIAGENMVAYACIMNNRYSSWGRTGMGAVMGSKKLKAIAVRGNNKLKVFSEEDLTSVRREAFNKIKNDASFVGYQKYGSMSASTPNNKIGALPGRNFTVGSFDDWEETMGTTFFEYKFKEKNIACFSCPIACANWSKVDNEKYKNYETKGPEITFVNEFGARLLIKNLPEIFQCVELCNRYGMDVISTASNIAFLIECFENGLITANEVGFSPKWGNYEHVINLIHMIANKKHIGQLLAKGVKKASAAIPGSNQFALHVKGVEISSRDPRATCSVWTLGYLTNTRGGDQLRSRSTIDNIFARFLKPESEEVSVSKDYIDQIDMPNTLKKEIFSNQPLYVNVPQMLKYSEDIITIINSLGFCIRPPVLRTLGPDYYARALNACYGSNLTAESLLKRAEDIWDLQHKFNVREGELFQDYKFPRRFYTEPQLQDKKRLPDYPPITEEGIQYIIDKYFKLRKWK